jgi:hypothetical protein
MCDTLWGKNYPVQRRELKNIKAYNKSFVFSKYNQLDELDIA